MGILDKYFERKFEKLGYSKSVQKMAGFMTTEIENDPNEYKESSKRSDYKDFVDCFNTLPWLYAGAMALAIAAPKPKLRIYEQVGKEEIEVLGQDINLLLKRPNPFLSFRELLQITVINMSIPGNHFWNLVGTEDRKYPDVVIDKENPPVEIWWIKPEQIEIKDHPEKYIDYYEFRASNTEKAKKLHPSEIIHFKMANPDSYFRGMGAMQPAKNTAILELNAVSYNKKFLENDAMPPWIFDFPEQPTETQFNTFQKRWNARHKGSKKGGNFGYIYGGTKIQELGKMPKDVQYAEMRKMNREELLACLPGSVPPSIVGLLEYANYSNMEVQNKKFWGDCVIPVLDLIADKLTLNFAPHFNDAYSFAFDYSDIQALQGDEKAKSEVAARLIEYGVKTPNQVRRDMYKEEPYPEGNQYYMKLGLVPAGTDTAEKTGKAKMLPIHKEKKKSFWEDEAKKKALWENFVKRIEAKEKAYIPIAIKYIKRQAKEIGENLKDVDDLASVSPQKLIDIEKETDKYIKDFRGWYWETFRLAGEGGKVISDGFLYDLETKNIFKQENEFVITPEIEELLQQMVFNSGTKVNETLIDIIYRTLQRSIKEEWTVEEFTQLILHQVDEFSGWRSRLWARTEAVKVENWGQIEGYKQTEFVEKKGWLSAFAPDSRDEHMAADGQVVGLNEFFVVMGEELQYPGDPSGSPGNVCNCLCATFPEVGEV